MKATFVVLVCTAAICLEAHAKIVTQLAWSPDAKELWVIIDSTCFRISPADARVVATKPAPEDWPKPPWSTPTKHELTEWLTQYHEALPKNLRLMYWLGQRDRMLYEEYGGSEGAVIWHVVGSSNQPPTTVAGPEPRLGLSGIGGNRVLFQEHHGSTASTGSTTFPKKAY